MEVQIGIYGSNIYWAMLTQELKKYWRIWKYIINIFYISSILCYLICLHIIYRVLTVDMAQPDRIVTLSVTRNTDSQMSYKQATPNSHTFVYCWSCGGAI